MQRWVKEHTNSPHVYKYHLGRAKDLALLGEPTYCWLREMKPDSHINIIAVALIIHPFNVATRRQFQNAREYHGPLLSMHPSKHRLTHEPFLSTLPGLDNLYWTFPYPGKFLANSCCESLSLGRPQAQTPLAETYWNSENGRARIGKQRTHNPPSILISRCNCPKFL